MKILVVDDDSEVLEGIASRFIFSGTTRPF